MTFATAILSDVGINKRSLNCIAFLLSLQLASILRLYLPETISLLLGVQSTASAFAAVAPNPATTTSGLCSYSCVLWLCLIYNWHIQSHITQSSRRLCLCDNQATSASDGNRNYERSVLGVEITMLRSARWSIVRPTESLRLSVCCNLLGIFA